MPTTLRYLARASSRLRRNSASAARAFSTRSLDCSRSPSPARPPEKREFTLAEDLFMVGDVLLGKANQPHIAHNVDVSFGGVQRDQFGSFLDARGGSINPCRLTPNVVDRCKSVEKNLSDDDGFLVAVPPRPSPDHGYRQGAWRENRGSFGRIFPVRSSLRYALAATACSASAEVRFLSRADLPRPHPRPG